MHDSRTTLFTSESVSMGHPDKLADQISDAVLDAMLEQDPMSRVACETLVTTGLAVIAGEVTTNAVVDIPDIVRQAVARAGYDDGAKGFDHKSCSVNVVLGRQSRDIAMGVDREGAGDQGMMFGFACNETPELMPLPIALSHALVKRQAMVREKGIVRGLRPDAKSQVTVEYHGRTPSRVDTVVLSTQHDPSWNGPAGQRRLKAEIIKHVIKPVLGKWWNDRITVHVNPTGQFEIGGPHGDCGLTGRKIIVDTYGGMARHGGGAFSGKDPSKVDRSAAYAARWVAKNVVAAGFAKRAEVQVAYAIGVARPVSVSLETYGTETRPVESIEAWISENFDLRPGAIVENLNLRRPIYQKTAAYGHFGRPDPDFTWESTAVAQEAGGTLAASA